MPDADTVVEYFSILEVLQQASFHRVDQPVKELILFHSMHASIYYAVWYGLFDTLELLSSKLEVFQTYDLVAAELEFSPTIYTSQIIKSIEAYAEKVKAQGGLATDALTYTAAPMEFHQPSMQERYDVFLGALRKFMQTSK